MEDNNVPINCPKCGAIQTKRSVLRSTLEEKMSFRGTCWKCNTVYIVNRLWKVFELGREE